MGAAEVPASCAEGPAIAPAGLTVAATAKVVPLGEAAAVPRAVEPVRHGGAAVEAGALARTAADAPTPAGHVVASEVPRTAAAWAVPSVGEAV